MEDPACRNPPAVIEVAAGEEPGGLQVLTPHIAALIAEEAGRIRQQGLTIAPEDPREQARSKCQFIAFPGHCQRLDFAQRKESAQIVFSIERAYMLDQATLLSAGGLFLVFDL